MKSLFKVSLLAATVMLAVGCQKEEAPKEVKPTAQVETKAPKATAAFQSEDDKAAYAIGVSFANYLNASLDKPAEYGIVLKKELVLEGIEQAFAGTVTLTEDEIRQTLENLDQRVAETMQKQSEEIAAAAKQEGDAYRAVFEKQQGVQKTDTGLLYLVETAGEGKQPEATDTVVVHYKGTLIDGTQFDSSYDRGEPATFPLDRVIPGWTEGVQLMKPGAKYKFVIPPELAYGEQDTPAIPANSTLVFEVELLSVEDDKAPAQ